MRTRLIAAGAWLRSQQTTPPVRFDGATPRPSEIWLAAEDGNLRIVVRGALAAILRLAEGARTQNGADLVAGAVLEQVKMDAGTRNRRSQYVTVQI